MVLVKPESYKASGSFKLNYYYYFRWKGTKFLHDQTCSILQLIPSDFLRKAWKSQSPKRYHRELSIFILERRDPATAAMDPSPCGTTDWAVYASFYITITNTWRRQFILAPGFHLFCGVWSVLRFNMAWSSGWENTSWSLGSRERGRDDVSPLQIQPHSFLQWDLTSSTSPKFHQIMNM